MANKGFRRVKAGELGLADLLSGDTLYITGLADFYTDTKYAPEGYEYGKVLRAPCVASIIEHFNLSDQKARSTFRLSIKLKKPDALFTEMLGLHGIGQESAVLACLGFLGKIPDLKYIYASAIHKALFVSYGESSSKAFSAVLEKIRTNNHNTILSIENARKTARVIAAELLSSSKLKNKPNVDDVVELSISMNTDVDKSGRWLIDKDIHVAEVATRELIKTKLPVPEYGEITKYTENAMFEDQKAALDGILNSDSAIMVMQGGPGSGKSHVIAALVHQYLSVGTVPLVTSYMNKACLNLFERLRDDYCFHDLYNKPKVPTIHSVYGKLSSMRERHVFNWPLIIVDESSVLSSDLLRMLMEIRSYSPDTRILFVGDRYQLSPVCAYGTPFHNLVRHPSVTKFELTGFHRSNGNGIYRLLKKLSESANDTDTVLESNEDVKLYKARDMEQAMALAGTMARDHRDNMRRMVAVAETNKLKDKLNLAMLCSHLGIKEDSVPTRKSNGDDTTVLPILPGMRIVAKDNLKESPKVSGEVAKNEFGTLLECNDRKAVVHLDIMDRTVEISDAKHYLSSFDIGYASTVHKYQGSEADDVLYCIENYRNMSGCSFNRQKELKYVGMSRAKNRLCVLSIDDRSSVSGCREVDSISINTRNIDNAFMCF
jgi:hypothetical protein